jgi:hypothetical protein
VRFGVLALGVTLFGNAWQGDGIVRLKPGDFRQLPAAVRRDLDRRRCLIPQVPRKPAPHNVIAGSFITASSRDWAVLCSVKGESRVLVYRGGKVSRVDSLARVTDATYVQQGATGLLEYSRKLDVVTPRSIRDRIEADNGSRPPPLDHDGIDDGFWEKTSVVRYYSRGRWLELPAAD